MSAPRVVGRNEFEEKPPDLSVLLVFLAIVSVLGSVGTGIYTWNERDARQHQMQMYTMCLAHNPNCPIPEHLHK